MSFILSRLHSSPVRLQQRQQRLRNLDIGSDVMIRVALGP